MCVRPMSAIQGDTIVKAPAPDRTDRATCLLFIVNPPWVEHLTAFLRERPGRSPVPGKTQNDEAAAPHIATSWPSQPRASPLPPPLPRVDRPASGRRRAGVR